MKYAKATVLGIAILGAFSAGVGTLVRLITPLVGLLGWSSTIYILGMWAIMVGVIAYLLHRRMEDL